MGKCGVFIPFNSHQAIPIPVKLASRITFPWESYGIHWNSQYELIFNYHKIIMKKTRRKCASYD